MRIKICGLSRPADIAAVNAALPDYVGFIINFPASRRNVSPDTVRRLVQQLDPRIQPVGVFVDQPISAVAALLNDGILSVAQLHGHENAAYIHALRDCLTVPASIWQAFQLRQPKTNSPTAGRPSGGYLSGDCPSGGYPSAEWQAAVDSVADFVLLDSGQGSGVALDWATLCGFPRPFCLAGGLTPETVSRAIAQAAPCAVDLSSGVETDGYKDPQKIQAAVTAVRFGESDTTRKEG